MPLILPNLETDIKKAFKAASVANGSKAEAILAKQLARAIDKHIKSGVVNTIVATASGGPGTGVGVIS
tara:strand:- start:8842 stop:9045 length:204 start_codon:yes stop_codon:yes gene_type:complete